MSYFSPYVDGAGLHLPTYHDILDDMIAEMKRIYGEDIYLGNDSADYQFLSILALKVADSYQAVQYAYNARSPATATGSALDAIVRLNGISRKPAGYSTCSVVLKGTAFTEIKNGSVVDPSGVVWTLPESVLIGVDGTATATATCSVAGAVSALPGDLSKINTPTYGWKSVNNTGKAVLGNAIETDGELRQRQAVSVANPSQTMLSGTLGALRAVDNVSRVSVYENDTSLSEVDPNLNPFGLPPHSITCVVEGGDNQAIAEAILYHKGIGCYTNGDVEVVVTDVNNYENRVRFFRPRYADVVVRVEIRRYSGFISALTSQIQTAIYEYLRGFEIGRDVSISMLTGVVMGVNPNPAKPIFGVKAITIGRTRDALSAADIDLAYNEVARPDYQNVEVVS